MPISQTKQMLDAARDLLSRRVEFESLLSKLSPKDRINAEKRVSVLEAGPTPDAARLWRRLACSMMTLAPHSAKFVGRQTVQFYIADGKYRMQVFALEDLQDGNLTVYCPDVLEDAMQAGLLTQTPGSDDSLYVTKSSHERVCIESLDGSSLNPAAHYKDLVGWNRKALRITLLPFASPAQVEVAELMCAIAASRFAAPRTAERAAPVKS